eukprot:688596-Hanusia_phi.AAC.1
MIPDRGRAVRRCYGMVIGRGPAELRPCCKLPGKHRLILEPVTVPHRGTVSLRPPLQSAPAAAAS